MASRTICGQQAGDFRVSPFGEEPNVVPTYQMRIGFGGLRNHSVTTPSGNLTVTSTVRSRRSRIDDGRLPSLEATMALLEP